MTSSRDITPAPFRTAVAYMVIATANLATHLAVPNATVRAVCYLIGIAMVPVACVISARFIRPPRRLWLIVGATAAFFLVAQVGDMSLPSDAPLAVRLGLEAFRLAGQLTFVAVLITIVRHRRGRHGWELVSDAVIVALSAWLVCYLLLLRPTLERSSDPPLLTVVQSLYQPLGTVAIFLLLVLILADTFRPPAVWMFGGAIVFSLLGDLGWALDAAGRPAPPSSVADTAYLLAYLCGGAALLHPSVHALFERTPVGRSHSYTTRIALITASMLVPVLVLGLGRPANDTDQWIRAATAFAIVVAAVARTRLAVLESNEAQRRLLINAQHDPLTGLPNRALLQEQITEALHESWRGHARPTVLFIDLDRFKNINDSLGHAIGDQVLRLVGRRLRTALPSHVIIGRISGDEFMVLDPTVRSTGEAMGFADRVLSVFTESFHVGRNEMHVSASIGVAIADGERAFSAEELHRNADTAMYRAKEAGRNCIAVYDDSMHERVAYRLEIESALHRALDKRELQLFYQPIIDVVEGRVVGFEALMRWHMTDGRIVSPAEFIPIAEETGLITSIGSWALLEALTQLREWISDGVCGPTTSMSVNVSPRQLRDPQLISAVGEALLRSGVEPRQLWLEVTEGVMISEPEQALTTLRRLRSLGTMLAIDDFGTGYSSLNHLRRFPLQRIKIDRAFVAGVAEDDSSRSLVRTILAMARSLDLDVVAEGVESGSQLDALVQLGCSTAQGFLLSHPVPSESMRGTIDSLQRNRPWKTGTRPAAP